ncbi:MAG TPA: glycerol kinase GlpK [Anaerolineae bacterium]|mgnify:FL=1|nr:MAG: Glycerol kinase [Chloroflexi bacterium ADurb.Bin222]HOS79297.1 glycerol kinase GlpK [Anaerolineae bacterium]HQJ10867.1 glycerol kinase GlpK [Anaerolineae bacterium]HUM37167.1 glycerol kinase GlpK [Anaerolineae bacterium]
MDQYIAAIDQGTTGTRCILFDHDGRPVIWAYEEHAQLYPQPGWVEHDPAEIWEKTQKVIRQALTQGNIPSGAIAAIGITNQRETTVVWDRRTGEPLYNAIVWQDTRTKGLCDALARESDLGQDRFRAKVGLPLATYFSGPKIKWLLEHVPAVAEAAARGDALFGTTDTWVIWQLTGGARGGVSITDVTNASRTLLMDLHTLQWDAEILKTLGIPASMLPEIRPSSAPRPYGFTLKDGPFGEAIPVTGDLGDQQAALVGQTCFSPGEAKNTYGTGCFMLLNTGAEIVPSKSGLLTTLGYKFGDAPAVYALEGSIAITGALVQWLRDNLGFFDRAPQIEGLAREVEDAGGMYIVPAFSGLFAPYWRSDARGVMVGLTRYINKHHICRAALEATAYQTRDVLEAMEKDSGVALTALKVDGGMVANTLLMQFQADILGVPVVRPIVTETTALGAAYAAGLAVGFWKDTEELRQNWGVDHIFQPEMETARKEALYAGWQKAVERTFDWVEE